MKRFLKHIIFNALFLAFAGQSFSQERQFTPSTEHSHDETVQLTPEQQERARDLSQLLMAPCCYSKTAYEDQSGAAHQVKDQVKAGIAQGFSDEVILAGFAEVYGERILSRPEPEGLNILLWVLPFVILLMGILTALLFIKSRRRAVALAPDTRKKPGRKTSAADAAYAKRIEKELDAFQD